MEKEVKKRYWVIIGYPESLPENWKSILEQTGLKIAVSPLHNEDINESTQEKKKEHYHILVCYENITTFNNVKKLADKLNSPIPQYVESVRGAFRYLTHKDNPEKAQYKDSDIICINGFNIQDFAELSKSEVLKLKKAVLSVIRINKFTEYSHLMDYLDDNDLLDLWDIASSNTLFFDSYLRSARNSVKENMKEQQRWLTKAYAEYIEHSEIDYETISKLAEVFGKVTISED